MKSIKSITFASTTEMVIHFEDGDHSTVTFSDDLFTFHDFFKVRGRQWSVSAQSGHHNATFGAAS